MKNGGMVQSVNTLNFEPVKPWPSSLPALAWNGYVYAGFERAQISETFSFNRRFENVFLEAYPHLGLAELTRFYFLPIIPIKIDWVFFFSMYRLRFGKELIATMNLVRTLPPLFQLWIDERECTPHDIAPLFTLNFDDRMRLASYFAHARPAKTQGIEALEWARDLILLKHDIFEPIELNQTTTFEQWVSWIKRERFPHTNKTSARNNGRPFSQFTDVNV